MKSSVHTYLQEVGVELHSPGLVEGFNLWLGAEWAAAVLQVVGLPHVLVRINLQPTVCGRQRYKYNPGAGQTGAAPMTEPTGGAADDVDGGLTGVYGQTLRHLPYPSRCSLAVTQLACTPRKQR